MAGRVAGIGGDATGGAGDTGQAEAGEGGGGAPEQCGLDVPPVSCNAAPAGYVATIVDFTRYSSSGDWSSTTADGITGKTSLYHSSSAKDVVLAVDGADLHITATLEPMSFVGWVFAFDACSNGSGNIGLALPLAGDLGGAILTLRAQTNADYAVGISPGRGACSFTSCATRGSECKPPSIEIAAENLTNSVQYLFWTDFTGGMPEHHVTPDAIWGLQFELACTASTECVVDLTLGTVRYDQL